MSENKDWTVMIYMAGDNNLSEEMANTINQLRSDMQAKHQAKSVSFLIYFNSSVAVIPPLYCDITDKAAVNALKTVTHKEYLEQEGDDKVESSASRDSIVNFVKWCVNEKGYKADNYALFLSGHSNAFDENTLLRSDSSKEVLTIKQLKSALQEIYFVINEGKDETKPLDILGFDSCQMSMLEIGFEFIGRVRYLIASQGATPAGGWNYGNFLRDFIVNPADKTPEQFVKEVVRTYIEFQRNFDLGGRSVDIAAWDLNQSTEIISKVESLVELLRKLLLLDEKTAENTDVANRLMMDNLQFIVKRQIEQSLLMAHWKCQSYWLEQSIDVKDFCEQLFLDFDFLQIQIKRIPNVNELLVKYIFDILEDIRIKCKDVVAAVDKCVVAVGSLGADYQFSNGISLFFPWSLRALRLMKKPYLNLKFAVDKGEFWVDFLYDYLNDTMTKSKRKVTAQRRIWQTEEEVAKENGEPTKDAPSNGEEPAHRGTKTDVERGSKTDVKRGTKTDVERGTKTDVERGTLAFLNEFKSFKNYDSDYWDYFNMKPDYNEEQERMEKILKFSESVDEFIDKIDR